MCNYRRIHHFLPARTFPRKRIIFIQVFNGFSRVYNFPMVPRRSLRKKLAYTFLAGALLTVLLFSLVMKGIISDYFKREGAARLLFVQNQSTEAVRANLTVFKDRLQQMFGAGTVALNSLCQAGSLGDQLDHLTHSKDEREATTKILQSIQSQARLSFITVVDLNGKVVLRATNPSTYGDDTLMLDYQNPMGPVSSIRHFLQTALKGQAITAFEVFAPETLALENEIENGKIVSSLKDYAAIPVRGRDVTPGTVEAVLALTSATPLLDSRGKTVGAVIAAKVINRNAAIVQDVRSLLQDEATIFLGQLRITTTMKQGRGDHKGEPMVGTLNGDQVAVAGGVYNERRSIRPINGEEVMGVFDPIKDYDGVVLGSLYLGRPLSYLDEISKAQGDIETAVERRTTVYIIVLVIVSTIIAIAIASLSSKRISRQIDQLRKGAETISDGNLDYRLKIASGDEIELLAEQFNSMASKLQDSYQTLEKKVEERTRELKESQETMVQQGKMVGIGQLAAGIAHELNTPLGTIIGYAQMLREDLALQPSVNGNIRDVDEIMEQAVRCRDLVKNLLNFSRRSTTEKSLADINAIVRKITSLVEHDFEMKGVQVHLRLDAALPKARVNENEVAQVILNLANNAADSMPEGGKLNVTTAYEEDTDRVRIEIHDTGLGISEFNRTRVFEPFFTTKEVGKGTGLGLSICYKIIENHMGSMEFDSVTGQGTTFRVYIPVNVEVRVV